MTSGRLVWSYADMIRLILFLCGLVAFGLGGTGLQLTTQGTTTRSGGPGGPAPRRVCLDGACLALSSGSAAAQTPAATGGLPPISASQARNALDVLNDPARRAAFAATLEAIVKAQTGGPETSGSQPGSAASGRPAKPSPEPHPAETAHSGTAAGASSGTPPGGAAGTKPEAAKPEGLKIPLEPDSLGADVLQSASAFVNRFSAETMNTLDTVQSLPLLYGWALVMATNPVAQSLLLDVSWRVAVVLLFAVAVEYGLRRATRRPIRALEATAPTAAAVAEDEPDEKTRDEVRDGPESEPGEDDANSARNAPVRAEAEEALARAEGEEALARAEAGDAISRAEAGDAISRAEAGDIEPPQPARRGPSAWMLLRRVPVVLARLVLELIPVLGILLTGHLMAASSSIGGNSVSRLVILAVIDSYALCSAILCLARMLLSPGEGRLRLFHLPDATAGYLMRWIRRLVVVAVLGYAVGEVGLLLGLSQVAHDMFEKTVGLVLHAGVAFIVVQKRRAVCRVLRAPEGRTGPVARLRNSVAAVWHWIALFILFGVWLVWAIEVRHGFATLMHYFIVTSLVLIGARLLLLLLLGIVDRVMRPSAEKPTISPAIDARLRMYEPTVALAIRFTVYLLCVLGLLQLYGMNTFVWLIGSELGLRVVTAACTILLTVVLAFVVWEVANASIHGHLDRLERESQMSRSARLRTLLPLLRTTLMIGIAIFAGLTVLSEVGINIAPLLAGAGIVGVAIGFGSQKLVQDLITGIFLLLENAMQVGDTVTVSGLTGTVEALSVRTIRLRAGDGSVHLIPFSSVTSVTNVNRGLGNASVNVVVAFEEDTDRVFTELKAIVTDMRNDAALSAMMLGDLQLWGIDKVDGAGVTIAGQVVCTDTGRWTVQREFNRRMKRRFQELGIRIYNPLQTIEVNVPPAANAPLDKGVDHARAAAAN